MSVISWVRSPLGGALLPGARALTATSPSPWQPSWGWCEQCQSGAERMRVHCGAGSPGEVSSINSISRHVRGRRDSPTPVVIRDLLNSITDSPGGTQRQSGQMENLRKLSPISYIFRRLCHSRARTKQGKSDKPTSPTYMYVFRFLHGI